jgi:hypothetical protein
MSNYRYEPLETELRPMQYTNRTDITTDFAKFEVTQHETKPNVFIQEDLSIRDPKERAEKVVKYIIHKIEYTDSMEGLALQYNVSEREIRIFNGLTTNDIYYLKELKIPDPDLENLHMTDSDYDIEEFRKRQKIHTIQKLMDPKDVKAAQFYLDENGWDVNRAFDNYKQDIEFEKNYQKHTETKHTETKHKKNIQQNLLEKKYQ